MTSMRAPCRARAATRASRARSNCIGVGSSASAWARGAAVKLRVGQLDAHRPEVGGEVDEGAQVVEVVPVQHDVDRQGHRPRDHPTRGLQLVVVGARPREGVGGLRHAVLNRHLNVLDPGRVQRVEARGCQRPRRGDEVDVQPRAARARHDGLEGRRARAARRPRGARARRPSPRPDRRGGTSRPWTWRRGAPTTARGWSSSRSAAGIGR
jgi:hypothetical protein